MIYVITHKKFDDSIISSPLYKVLHVGKNDDCKDYYLRDDSGDNISNKNDQFCELTGLYWIWKNVVSDDEITGLVHYRRYFTTLAEYNEYRKNGCMPHILSDIQIKNIVNADTIILPSAYKTISTLRNSYKRCHNIFDLDVVETTIRQNFPEYFDLCKKVLAGHKGYYYNMFICTGKILREYCEWLFSILFAVENKLKSVERDEYQNRVYGFLSERLLQIWILKRRIRIIEFPVFNIEKQPQTYMKRNYDRICYLVHKYASFNFFF